MRGCIVRDTWYGKTDRNLLGLLFPSTLVDILVMMQSAVTIRLLSAPSLVLQPAGAKILHEKTHKVIRLLCSVLDNLLSCLRGNPVTLPDLCGSLRNSYHWHYGNGIGSLNEGLASTISVNIIAKSVKLNNLDLNF